MKTNWQISSWKRSLVFGLGESGRAATRLLRSLGIEVVAVDRRLAESLPVEDLLADSGVELMLGDEPETLPENIDGVVLSPGVPRRKPLIEEAEQKGLPVIAEVELAYRCLDGAIVGITGSNGKSTTTTLTGALLEAAGYAVEVCGNIGVPLSARVAGPPGRIFVTELSSFQLESIDSFRPRAAALLNLSVDHLDRHRDSAEYLSAKKRLFENQQREDTAVLNADDEVVSNIEVPARRRFFSRRGPVDDGCFLDGNIVVEIDPLAGRQSLFRLDDLALPGVHNLENAMAAVLLSRALQAEPSVFPGVLSTVVGLPHRMQKVASEDGIDWIDDSKATNLAATIKSLQGCLDGTVHLILGGRHKGGDPAELVAMVKRKAVRLYLIGESASVFRLALGSTVPCEMCGDLVTAVSSAASFAKTGETVLLAPACASFDQYSGFAERGDHFRRLVEARRG